MAGKMTKKVAANYLAQLMTTVVKDTGLEHQFMPEVKLVKIGRKHTYEVRLRFVCEWWTAGFYRGTNMRHVVAFINKKIIEEWGYEVTYPRIDTIKIG